MMYMCICDATALRYSSVLRTGTRAGTGMQVCPNLNILVPALVEGGIDELEKRCALTPGWCWHCSPHLAYVDASRIVAWPPEFGASKACMCFKGTSRRRQSC